jgi:two-component system, NarL family, sensor kinase
MKNILFFCLISISVFGQHYRQQYFLEDSLMSIAQSEALIQEAVRENDSLAMAYGYHYLGRAVGKNNQRAMAVANYYKAMSLAEKTQDWALLNMLKFRIATSFVHESALMQDAQQLFNETLPYYKRIKNDRLVVLHLVNLARIRIESRDYDQANSLLHECMELNQKTKHPLASIIERNLRGRLYLETNQIQQAIVTFEAASRISQQYGNHGITSLNIFYLGVCYESVGRYSEALNYYKQALHLTHKANEPFIRRDAHQRLMRCYKKINNGQLALYHAEYFIKIADSLHRLTSIETTNFIKLIHEKEKIETEKRLLETESRLNRQRYYAAIFIGLIILLLGTFGILFFRQKLEAKRHEYEANELKIREIESDREIITMKVLLEGQDSERKRIAEDLHDGLGGMLAQLKLGISTVFQKVSSQITSTQLTQIKDLIEDACREVRNISDNLQPATLERFGLIVALQDYIQKVSTSENPHFSFQAIGNDQSIPADQQLMIFRTVQEAINNALKHARATEIFVQMHIDEHNLIVEVEDNGSGFDFARHSEGMGLKNLEMRAKYLKASLHVQSKSREGTNVLLHVPL